MSSNSAFNRFARFKALVALSLIAGLGSYGLGTFVQAQQQQEDQAQSQATREGLRHADALSNAFQEVARTIGPSVVNIRSTVEAPQQTMRPSQRQPDPGMMEEFFRDLPPSLRSDFAASSSVPCNPISPCRLASARAAA